MPRTLTLASRLSTLDTPATLAERLPKCLIHHNVPGERVHAFLRDFDRAWASCAPYRVYGTCHRWIETALRLSRDWPIPTTPPLWRPHPLAARRTHRRLGGGLAP